MDGLDGLLGHPNAVGLPVKSVAAIAKFVGVIAKPVAAIAKAVGVASKPVGPAKKSAGKLLELKNAALGRTGGDYTSVP